MFEINYRWRVISCCPSTLASALPFIKEVTEAHWRFCGDPKLPPEPNWPVYEALERVGALLLLLAYENDRPVGYMAAFQYPHMHSRTRQIAVIPTYFVEQRPARAGIIRALLREAIGRLTQSGVVRIYVETEIEHSLGRLLACLGFRANKIGYALEVGHA